MDERQLRERLAKIKALFDGATTEGEREAAKAAMHRVQSRLDQAAPPQLTEYSFSLTNPWSLRLFLALCRSKGLKPYRYPRMRRTSFCCPSRVRPPRTAGLLRRLLKRQRASRTPTSWWSLVWSSWRPSTACRSPAF